MSLQFTDIGDLSYVRPLTLDVSGGLSHLYIEAKQNDKKSRYLGITVTKSGQAYTIPEGTTPRFRCTKPDGNVVFDDGCVNAGKVYVELTEQALAVPGRARADIGLYKGSSLLSTVTFFIEVVQTPYDENAVISSDEFSALTDALERVDNVGDVADEALANSEEALENLSTLNAAEAARAAAEIQRASAETERQSAETARQTAEEGRLPYEIAMNGLLGMLDHYQNLKEFALDDKISQLSTNAGAQSGVDSLMLAAIHQLFDLASDAQRTTFSVNLSSTSGLNGVFNIAIPDGCLRNSIRYTVIAEVSSATGGSLYAPIINSKQANGFKVNVSSPGTVTAATINFTLIGGMA